MLIIIDTPWRHRTTADFLEWFHRKLTMKNDIPSQRNWFWHPMQLILHQPFWIFDSRDDYLQGCLNLWNYLLNWIPLRMFAWLKELSYFNLRYSGQVKLWENYITFGKVLNECEKQHLTIARSYRVVSKRDNWRSEIQNGDVEIKKTYELNFVEHVVSGCWKWDTSIYRQKDIDKYVSYKI